MGSKKCASKPGRKTEFRFAHRKGSRCSEVLNKFGYPSLGQSRVSVEKCTADLQRSSGVPAGLSLCAEGASAEGGFTGSSSQERESVWSKVSRIQKLQVREAEPQGRSGWRRAWRNFLREEGAQATIEYILILSVVVGIALVAFRVLRPRLRAWADALSRRIDDTLFRGNVHRFQFRR